MNNIPDLDDYAKAIKQLEDEVAVAEDCLELAKATLAKFREENDPEAISLISRLKKLTKVQTLVTDNGVFRVRKLKDKIVRKSDAKILAWCEKEQPLMVRREAVIVRSVPLDNLKEFYQKYQTLPHGAEFSASHDEIAFERKG